MADSGTDAAHERLDDQIAWYDRKASFNRTAFKIFKLWTILAAAAVPLLAAFGVTDVRILATLSATIAVAETVQQLNQYQANWISYRSTCEALRHEKYLYLSSAGPYAGVDNRTRLLAERVEALAAQENSKWITGQQSLAAHTAAATAKTS